jgi:hypothetical protein
VIMLAQLGAEQLVAKRFASPDLLLDMCMWWRGIRELEGLGGHSYLSGVWSSFVAVRCLFVVLLIISLEHLSDAYSNTNSVRWIILVIKSQSSDLQQGHWELYIQKYDVITMISYSIVMTSSLWSGEYYALNDKNSNFCLKNQSFSLSWCPRDQPYYSSCKYRPSKRAPLGSQPGAPRCSWVLPWVLTGVCVP